MDRPQSEPILVSLDCLRRCPEEVGDEFWPPGKTSKKTRQSPARQAGPIQQPPADQERAGGSGLQEQTAGDSTQELNEAEVAIGSGDEDSHDYDGEGTTGMLGGKH